jgi:hypothetical protein
MELEDHACVDVRRDEVLRQATSSLAGKSTKIYLSKCVQAMTPRRGLRCSPEVKHLFLAHLSLSLKAPRGCCRGAPPL